MSRLPIAAALIATTALAQVTASFRNGQLPTASYGGMTDVVVIADTGEPWNPAANHEGVDNFIDGTPNNQGTLMRFDVSTIPAAATVSAATLSLSFGDGTSNSYSIYALSRAWVATQATWNVAATGQPWQTPGAAGATDRASASGGTVTGTGTINVILNATGRAMVQAWITSSAANFGLTIQNYAANDGTNLRHCDFASAAQRPQLTVNTDMGDFVFRNGVAAYAGCTDVGIGDGPNPVTTNWDDSTGFEIDGAKAIWIGVTLTTVPPWATVLAASMNTEAVSDSSSTFYAYEAARPWSEAQATWLNAATGTPWQQPGGAGPLDRSSVVLGSWVAPGDDNSTLVFNDAGVAAVERWVRTPMNNLGFTLQNFAAVDSFRYSESEVGSISDRPRFSVTYFEGRVSFASAAGVPGQPLAVTVQRDRLDLVPISTGAPAMTVLVTGLNAAQVSADGGSFAASALVSIPAGSATGGFFILRADAGMSTLRADAGPAWQESQGTFTFAEPIADAGTDAGADAGLPDAGTPDAGAADAGPGDAGAPDAGEPPDAGPGPSALAVGCGCGSASGAQGLLLLLSVLGISRRRRASR